MGYTQEQKNEFLSLMFQGKKVKEIKDEYMMDIPLSTLFRWASLAKTNGHLLAKKSPGRPLLIKGRDERHLIRVSKANTKLTIKQIAQQAGIAAHHQTIVRVLKRPELQSFPMLKKPKLTDDHIRKRLRWALSVRHKTLSDWKKWTFSDECSVSLDCSEGVRRVVINRKDRHLMENCIGRKQGGGGKLMLWSFIFWNGRGPMVFIKGGINQELYKEILNAHVLPHCLQMLAETGEAQIFMDDGASSHDAHAVHDYCAQLGIQRPYWPPNSPDMNPIEHIWGWLKHYLTNLDPVPRSLAEVETAVKLFYERIDFESIRKLYNSMTERVKALLDANGGSTKY